MLKKSSPAAGHRSRAARGGSARPGGPGRAARRRAPGGSPSERPRIHLAQGELHGGPVAAPQEGERGQEEEAAQRPTAHRASSVDIGARFCGMAGITRTPGTRGTAAARPGRRAAGRLRASACPALERLVIASTSYTHPPQVPPPTAWSAAQSLVSGGRSGSAARSGRTADPGSAAGDQALGALQAVGGGHLGRVRVRRGRDHRDGAR